MTDNLVVEMKPARGINTTHRREKHFAGEYIAVRLDTGACIVSLREYSSSTGGSNSCCVWIADRESGTYASGSGTAGGYGYHRPSAAAHQAIRAAGFTLRDDIDGFGESATRDAVAAIARHVLGAVPFVVIHAHP